MTNVVGRGAGIEDMPRTAAGGNLGTMFNATGGSRLGEHAVYPDVAAEVVGEHDPAQYVALDQDEGGKPQRARERPCVVVGFGTEQYRVAFLILELPARHAEDRGSSTVPGDVIGI
jgi:hypothetical protein